MGDHSSFTLELTVVAISAVVTFISNVILVRSNRRSDAALRKQLAEESDRKDDEQELKQKVERHDRMLEYLKLIGIFARNRHTKSGGIDFDLDN